VLGHRGVGPSNRDHPARASVLNPSPRQLPPGLSAFGPPTPSPRVYPVGGSVKKCVRPHPPRSGPSPVRIVGDRVGGNVKTYAEATRKKAAQSRPRLTGPYRGWHPRSVRCWCRGPPAPGAFFVAEAGTSVLRWAQTAGGLAGGPMRPDAPDGSIGRSATHAEAQLQTSGYTRIRLTRPGGR
jgi:hypothetical protein